MKKILILIVILLSLGATGIWLLEDDDFTASTPFNTHEAENELAVPTLIDSREFDHDIELTIQNAEHEFYDGISSETMGFSQSYLGPTIKLYDNENTRIRFTNEIGEETTIHGHGLHVPGNLDGGPQNSIGDGETWDVTLPIQQQASTNWYHPHLHGNTAAQVHAGLAGMYIIEDENSLSLPLPKSYGVDDIPLIIQDRNFTDGVMEKYSVDEDEMMDGKREDTLVINGTIDPYIEVPQGWIRLRLLNGSNARFYDFHLADNEPFYKIATEGGFLEEPVEITSMLMVPGERNEVMIDLSDGNTRELLAELLPVDDDRFGSNKKHIEQVLEIRVDQSIQGEGELPEQLNTIIPWDEDDAVVIREFELEMEEMEESMSHGDMMDMHSMFSINGKAMDMSRIDEEVNLGDIEIWRITRDEMDHPFHMHGVSFLILSENGRPPAPEDQGWKDTVLVGYGWTELIMKFEHEATEEYPYMYHCHILEHEDGGMMGQFTVQ